MAQGTPFDPSAEPLPAEVALFPLPDHVLLPGVPSPYRVFEPRYRALVQDLLDRPSDERWLCVPRLAEGWREDYHGRPAVHEIATVGRIRSCEPLAGGHFFVLVDGVARVRLEERPSERPYRLARPVRLPDLPSTTPAPRLARMMETLVHSVYALTQLLGGSAEDLADAAARLDDLAVYRIAASVIDEADTRQRLLEERRPDRRVALVVDALAGLLGLAGRHTGVSSPA